MRDKIPSTTSIGWNSRTIGLAARRSARKLALAAISSGLAGMLARAIATFHRRRGLLAQGRIAGVRRRHDDQTGFWSQARRTFPADPGVIRCFLHAALRSGRIEEAEEAFFALVEANATVSTDCDFVVGLVHAALWRGDVHRIRVTLRRFLASLRGTPDYRIAAVRLSRSIWAHFPRKGQRAMTADRLRFRFLGMLERSNVQTAPRRLLIRAAACEARLEQTCCCFFDTDVSASQRGAFVALVRARLLAQVPFSFVRVGDGEAACFDYEPGLARLAAGDARERERIWWGRPLANEVRSRMAPQIADAIWNADSIGIPTMARFLRELRLTRNEALETSLTGRGLRAVLHAAERMSELRAAGLPAPVMTSSHLHHDLALWGCYGELMDGVKEVVLVSCHPGLPDWIGRQFGVRVAGHVLLPPDRVSGPLLGQVSPEIRTLPQMLGEAIDGVRRLAAGRLVLVGAGYPGKLLTREAARSGGIALDLGSIFDYWLGLNTRSYLDRSPV